MSHYHKDFNTRHVIVQIMILWFDKPSWLHHENIMHDKVTNNNKVSATALTNPLITRPVHDRLR